MYSPANTTKKTDNPVCYQCPSVPSGNNFVSVIRHAPVYCKASHNTVNPSKKGQHRKLI
jgi:hypothetical protein